LRDRSLAAHFFYGAAAGALIAFTGTRHGPTTGATAGAAVWAASYLGWIPALGVLRQAGEHPAQRNALMIGVHLIWGMATTLAIRELAAARDTIMSGGSLHDAPRDRPTHSSRKGNSDGGQG
jgi:Na+/proline symporter